MVLNRTNSVKLQRGGSLKTSRSQFARKKWAELGSLFRANLPTALARSAEDAAAAQEAASAEQVAASEGIRTTMGEGESVPFWMQGDLTLYSKDNLKRRHALRHHPVVVEELQNWWSCALRSMQSGGHVGEHELSRQRYEQISLRIYKAMIETYDEDEARSSAAQDWAQDCRGECVLSRERFMDAMFELADVWTKSIDPEECAAMAS